MPGKRPLQGQLLRKMLREPSSPQSTLMGLSQLRRLLGTSADGLQNMCHNGLGHLLYLLTFTRAKFLGCVIQCVFKPFRDGCSNFPDRKGKTSFRQLCQKNNEESISPYSVRQNAAIR